MRPERLDQARPFFVLAVAIAAWALVPAVAKRVARVSFFEFQAPLEVAPSAVRDLQEYWSLRTRSQDELIAAGQALSRLNSAYEVSIQENAALRGEISRLEELLRLPPQPNYRSETARVTRRDFTAWWQRLVIRKGTVHGIKVGAPVIFVGGVVGRVAEAGLYTSVVELTSNPGVRLAAAIEGDTRPINFQGGINEGMARPRGRVEFVPLDVFASPTAPKRLVTSGLGGVFPPGIVIGEITRLEPGPDGLFKSGEVLLDPRLLSVTEVTVLVPRDELPLTVSPSAPSTP
ncbi:rod shape-determining protein MreC [Nibricoccus sp. IMCC34717]|uniref:rod shape-determining protein MreC n=1 Tax=Nibricoccus sp. IMCC34717 TaxID=3034021 RepID=UPI00384E728C